VTLPEFPCQVGDVVTIATGESAWLSGALVFSEEHPVAALFVAPEAERDRALYATPKPHVKLLWLEPQLTAMVAIGAQPPSALEIDHVTFRRVRRLPCRAEARGSGAPDLGDIVTVIEYASMGPERLVVLRAPSGACAAYLGRELAEGTFDVVTPSA
jgi:hypothetical protein